MHRLAKNKSKNAAECVARPNASGKLWQYVRRRLDRSAVDNNDVRSVCHHLKTIITGKHSRFKTPKPAKADVFRGRSEQASVERHESPKKTSLLQPLKQAWRKTTSKTPGDNSRKDEYQNQLSASNITTLDEDDTVNFSDASSFSMVSEYARRLESSHTRTRPRVLSQFPQSGASATVLPDPHTTDNSVPAHRGHVSEGYERSPTFIAYDIVSHLQSTSQHHSVRSSDFGGYEPATNDKSPFQTAQIYPRNRQGAKTLPARRRTYSYHRSTVSSQTLTPSPSEGLLTVNRADYDRIMNAVYRPTPSRIPIPVFWKNAFPRAYNFRGPSSPYQEVNTVPLRAQKKRIDSASAMEPQLPTPPWSSLSFGQNSAPILRDIAARPALKFPSHTHPTTEHPSHQGPSTRHIDRSTLNHRPKGHPYTLLQRQTTLPRDWRLKNSSPESIPPIPTSSRILSGSNRSRFLPPVTLNDDGDGGDVWCSEGSVHADRSIIQACDSASSTDESQLQSCVLDADEDIWVGEASRSHVAVVDEPLH
jgi:hypothetical protein